MRSIQLRGYRESVHTIGLTSDGVLYIDVQRFGEEGCQAWTDYVRPADVLRVRRLVSRGRPLASETELLALLAGSFHSAEYALEWLRWARIPTIRRYDVAARYNAEEQIPREALT